MIVFSMLFALISFGASANTGQVLSGSNESAQPGQKVTVEFSLNDGVDLSAISFRVNFDSQAFEVSDEDSDWDGKPDSIVTPEGLNMGSVESGIFNNYVNIAAFRSGGTPVPVDAAGVKVSVANIEFTVKPDAYNGTYPITITELYTAGYDGEIVIEEPVAGSITITGGEDPEPGTDKTALAAKIAEAQGLEEEDYTAASWAVLAAALADAITVFEDDDATQQEVDDALADLIEAINDLVPVPADTYLQIGSVSGEVGSNVTVPVSIVNAQDVTGYQVNIIYDETKLDFVKVESSISADEGAFVGELVENGNIGVALGDDDEISLNGNTEIFTIEFTIKAAGDIAVEGAYYDDVEDKLVPNKAIISDADANEIEIEVNAGQVTGTVSGPDYGNADGDGEITVADVTFTLKVALGIVQSDEDIRERADVNGSGKVTVADAVLILRYLAAGGNFTFPVQGD